MSTDLISILQLDSNQSSKVITVKETKHCDSSFILSCVMSHSIKNKYAVIILSTHNSLMHYQQIGLKMNYSLQKQIDSGLVTFYCLGEKIVNDVLQNQHFSLVQQFVKINEIIKQMMLTNQTVNIIFDGISHLFDLGFTLLEVNAFCCNLIKLSRNINNSFIFFHCNVACEDDITYTIANLLSHKSHTILTTDNLLSGLSTDVTGHLIIKHPFLKFQTEHMFNIDQKSEKYLFKLFDRGVKLFAPGTV